MSDMSDVEELVERYRHDCFVGTPASDERIRDAETFLGVQFPEDYRTFLRKWGTLAIGPIEIYGITGDSFETSAVPNGIWFTHDERTQVSLPKHLVVLCDNEGDEFFCRVSVFLVGRWLGH